MCYFQVALPYLKSKLQSVYNKEREATLQESLWVDNDERLSDTANFNGGNHTFSAIEASARARLIKRLQKTVFACYPWLHAGNEGPCSISFAFNCLMIYLFL